MQERELNPYAAPSTPSDQITSKPEKKEEDFFISENDAYRLNNSLFCKPAFIPPPVCLLSGVKVKSELEKTTILTGSTSISIYLTQKRRSKINWDTVPTGQILTVLLIILIMICMATHLYFMLLIIVPVVIYGCRTPKNHGIKVIQHPTGFIEVLNTHPDFIQYFPTRPEQK